MAKRGRPKKTPMAANAAAGQAGGEKTGAYFRRIFTENPRLLGISSNAELFERWLADHPGHAEVPKNIKAHLFNIKSTLRKKGRKKGGRPKAVAQSGAVPVVSVVAVATMPKLGGATVKHLEVLEERIDDALTQAKHLDPEGLEEVIRLLRKARNTVVCRLGE